MCPYCGRFNHGTMLVTHRIRENNQPIFRNHKNIPEPRPAPEIPVLSVPDKHYTVRANMVHIFRKPIAGGQLHVSHFGCFHCFTNRCDGGRNIRDPEPPGKVLPDVRHEKHGYQNHTRQFAEFFSNISFGASFPGASTSRNSMFLGVIIIACSLLINFFIQKLCTKEP